MITVFLEVFFDGSKDDVETYVMKTKKTAPAQRRLLGKKKT